MRKQQQKQVFSSESESDSDYEQIKKKGKKRGRVITGRDFVDDAASEDEMEEESYIDSNMDQEELKERETLKLESHQFVRENKRHQPGFISMENEEDLNDYFKDQEDNLYDDDYQQNNLISQYAIHPTVNDPKLFQVRCKLGAEKQVVLSLLNKYFYSQSQTLLAFKIQSVSYIEKFPGQIFIEADNEGSVRKAIQDLHNLQFKNRYFIQIVPIKEVIPIFKADNSKNYDLKENQWVRIKKGPYENDLGQIVHIDESGEKALIKLIPRLIKNNEDNSNNYRFMALNKLRHNQKFFISSEYQNVQQSKKHYSDVIIYQLYQGNYFYEGFLHKEFHVRDMLIENIIPKIEEVEMFSKGESDENQKRKLIYETNLHIQREKIKQNRFESGDQVKVISGEYINMIGVVVTSVDKDISVEFKGILEEAATFRPEELQKHFKNSEYVKVIDGKYEGSVGVISKINDKIASLILQDNNEEIRVFVNDLKISKEVESRLESKIVENNFKKMDLIRIRSTTEAGLVLRVNRDTLEVLELNGEINNITLFQVDKKLVDKFMKQQNRFDQFITIDATVKILQGNNKGKSGIVKSIYKDNLFLFDQEHTHTQGIFIEKVYNCFVLTQNINDKQNHIQYSKKQYTVQSTIPSSQQQSAQQPQQQQSQKKDNMIGKMCVVLKGSFKGYQGLCRDSDDNGVRLELSGIQKVKTFAKDMVCSLDQESKLDTNSNNNTNNKNIIFNSNTPNIYGGRSVYNPQTPFINEYTQQSPAPNYGMHSPGYNK